MRNSEILAIEMAVLLYGGTDDERQSAQAGCGAPHPVPTDVALAPSSDRPAPPPHGPSRDGEVSLGYIDAGETLSRAHASDGTEGPDEIVLYDADDEVHGKGGDDKIWGNGGDDKLYGDSGDDQLLGEEDSDELSGGNGDDISWGGTGDDRLSGDTGDDQLLGEEDSDELSGGEGVDILWGGSGNDVLLGDDDEDMLIGGAGADTLDGGVGVDTASYQKSAGGVRIDLVTGTGRGGDAEGDALIGIENVIGSTHDDTVIASGDANRIDGGAGWDKVDYSRSGVGVTIDLSGVPGAGGDAEGD
ncbi:hypothetical protein KXS07_37095, partial [Inquilinus limosus]|uniref:calcium-binding protein n=1 Tax=Inquilinus limosus TaxID=171674 RepID=UPI003F167721